jgi:hypothetical protein
MAVNTHWYTNALVNILGGGTEAEDKRIDYLTDDIYVMLCTSSYTPNKDSHETKADITNEVSSSTGYIAGGQVLASKTVTPGVGVVSLDATDPEWADSYITARYAVFYRNEGETDADKILLGYMDFDANKTSDGGPFTIEFNADGFLKATVS